MGLGDELKIKKASFVNGHELCPCLLFAVTAFSPHPICSNLLMGSHTSFYFTLVWFHPRKLLPIHIFICANFRFFLVANSMIFRNHQNSKKIFLNHQISIDSSSRYSKKQRMFKIFLSYFNNQFGWIGLWMIVTSTIWQNKEKRKNTVA